MGACGRALRVTAGAPRAALRSLEVGRLRLRDRALHGTLPLSLIRHYQLDGALGACRIRAFTVLLVGISGRLEALFENKWVLGAEIPDELQYDSHFIGSKWLNPTAS